MKKVWLIIICAYALFFLLTPPLATPDENDHYETVYWLSRGIYPYQPKMSEPIKSRFTTELYNLVDLQMTSSKRNLILPNYQAIEQTSLKHKTSYSQSQEAKFIPITLQSYQTPLFHLWAALFLKLGQFLGLPLFWLFYFVRLSSTIYYLALVFVSAKILAIFFKNKTIANYLLVFFAINPTVIKSGLSINPDIGMAFFVSLLFYLLLKHAPKHFKVKQVALYAIVAALAALNKFSGIFLAPAVGIYLLLKERLTRRFVVLAIIFGLIFSSLLLPWLTLNYQRYGTTSTTQGFYVATGHPVTPRPLLKSVVLAAVEFRHTIMHYSGFLGASNDRYPFKFFFLGYTIVLFGLALLGAWYFYSSQIKHKLLLSLFLLPYLGFLYSLSFFFKKTGMDWDIQGRYFLNGFFWLTLFLPYGLNKVLNLKLEQSAKILGLFAIWHYLFILSFVLIPGYYV